MGLVTHEQLCKVVWGIIIKNFMHKYSFIVSELLGRFKFQEGRNAKIKEGRTEEIKGGRKEKKKQGDRIKSEQF